MQLCLVHMIRNSLNYVPYKDRKAVATDLKAVATTAAEAELNLEIFEQNWTSRYPMIGKLWRANWARVIPFLLFHWRFVVPFILLMPLNLLTIS